MFRWLMFVSTLCLGIPEGLFAQTSDRSQALAQRVAALELDIKGLAQRSLVPVGLHSNTVLPVGELLGRTEMWFVRSEGNPVAQAGTSTKSPVLAGGLSLVLPLFLVNMAADCTECGEPGVLDNGLCFECAAEVVVRRRMDDVSQH